MSAISTVPIHPGVIGNNRTRRSKSLPRKFLRQGRLHLIPLYYLLNLSDLAREGIANSGSHDFADHIYRGVPSGRTALGRFIDARLLNMPAARAMRLRYKMAQQEIRNALNGVARDEKPLRILSVPCGLPRDIVELADELKRDDPQLLSRIDYVGMDLDPALLDKAKAFAGHCPIPSMTFHRGNALIRGTFPPGRFHCIASTGLGEFLNDDQLADFYANVYESLVPGGVFYTSATAREERSEWLLSAFELLSHYRTPARLRELLGKHPWKELTITKDESGLQAFIVARRT